MTALKILCCGDVEGSLSQLFDKVQNVMKKAGNFDLLFCVGDFLSADSEQLALYQKGEKKAPLTTFVLGPTKQECAHYYDIGDGGELAENIVFLGKSGVYATREGLRIAYLSGVESETSDACHFSRADVDAIQVALMNERNFQGVDVLLTSQWPAGIEQHAAPLPVSSDSFGSKLVSELAKNIKPRYHFVGLQDIHYERLPYRNHVVLAERDKHVTRFIGLATLNNKAKKKHLYAFNVVPMKLMSPPDLNSQPDGVTECPYVPAEKPAGKEEASSQFFYDMSAAAAEKRKGEAEMDAPDAKKQQQPRTPCWFCLASPEVEKHLVVSVGNQCYLALAKGGLSPDHVLILPISHVQSLVSCNKEVADDIILYKKALERYFRQKNLGMICFERNFRSPHLQYQVVPIDEPYETSVKDVFLEESFRERVPLSEIPTNGELRQIVPIGVPYFYAELAGARFVHRIAKGENFPLQFGRQAVCTLLNTPEKIDWRACALSKEEELEWAKSFRANFKKFDPFL